MINFHHLAGATPIALFGMLSLWAAASRRHWFLRTAVVSAAVLAALLIPAFQVVFMLGVQSLVVAAGMALWRRSRRRRTSEPAMPLSQRFRPRLSMETLMLAVVVVAVATAVVARTPRMGPDDWYQFPMEGLLAGAICLTCAWLVYGRAAPWFRLLAFPLLSAFWGCAQHAAHWSGAIVRYWFTVGSATIGQYLQLALRDVSGLWYNMTVVAFGAAVLCLWLVLVRRARWFDPFDELAAMPLGAGAERRVRSARAAVIFLFCLAALFPAALFSRLVVRAPIPRVELPEPNGYDDVVAAGNMIGPVAANRLINVNQRTDAQLRAELAKHEAAFTRMRAGFRKDSWNPYAFDDPPKQDHLASYYLAIALQAQSRYASRTGDLPLQIETGLDLLRLAQVERRGKAAEDYGILAQFEASALEAIRGLRDKLSAEQCIEVASQLLEIDRREEPWEVRQKRRRILEQNAGWKRRAQQILDEWNGHHIEQDRREKHLERVDDLRALIVDLGIQAFEKENGKRPNTLSELVPKYLPAIPDDTYSDGPFKYGDMPQALPGASRP